jgi:signal recognition particle subunit SEC65
VVVEVTARHPMSDLNPLWERLHGLRRPERPTAADALDAIRALGLDAHSRSWQRPAQAEFGSYQEMLEVTARRLCLTSARASDLDAALRDLGVNPSSPRLGGLDRDMVTMWWPGAA